MQARANLTSPCLLQPLVFVVIPDVDHDLSSFLALLAQGLRLCDLGPVRRWSELVQHTVEVAAWHRVLDVTRRGLVTGCLHVGSVDRLVQRGRIMRDVTLAQESDVSMVCPPNG